jgi:hypothetical protein
VILEILKHTPVWVFVLFAALVALGLTQIRTRNLSLPRLFALPVALVAFSIYGFVAAFGANAFAISGWLAGLLVTSALLVLVRFPRGVTYAERTFRVPGSWIPFFVIMVTFFSRYVISVSLAISPALAANAAFAAAVGCIYGLSSGFFVGRTVTILQSMQALPA